MNKSKEKTQHLIDFHRRILIFNRDEFLKKLRKEAEKKLSSLDVYFTITKQKNQYINVVEDCVRGKKYILSYIEKIVYALEPCPKSYEIIFDFIGEKAFIYLKEYVAKLEKSYKNILKQNKNTKRKTKYYDTYCYRTTIKDFMSNNVNQLFITHKKIIRNNEYEKITKKSFKAIEDAYNCCLNYLKRDDIIKEE